MKLKLPPPVVMLIFGIGMYVVATFLPFGVFEFFGRSFFIIAFIVTGMGIAGTSLVQFKRARTTIDPLDPSKASTLVTTGLFRYSRNPMYLSLFLFLLAWGLWLGNVFNVLLAVGFIAYMDRFQILSEEEALLKTFGKAYRRYCVEVRRWL